MMDDAQIIGRAKKMYGSDAIRIETLSPVVSFSVQGEPDGYFVRAWVFVPIEDDGASISLTQNEIRAKAEKGTFLCQVDDGFQPCIDDGSHAMKWLEAHGFKICFCGDKGTHNIVVTTCGIHLSTNGWLYTKDYANQG